MLEIKDLSKSFGRKKVLEKVSFTFEHGVYGLLGPNGAGKTTLMRCITGLYPIKKGSGEIVFDGVSTAKNSDYLAKVGYLPQKFGLFKDLKVKEMMLLLANLKEIPKKEAERLVEEAVELVNLTDRLGSKVGSLSGGMIRRLGVAQALLGEPSLIIFDEPTAGLDPEERLRFKNIISNLGRKKSATIIISTHIVEDVEAVCDHIAIMKEKTIAVSGSCQEIEEMANGKVFVLPEAEEDKLIGEYTVQKQFERDGVRMLRILSDEKQPFEDAVPNVEDGYICALKNA